MATALVSEPPPAQGGHIAVAVDALEACHHHDAALIQLLLALGVHALDAGVAVIRGGVEARLPAQQGNHRVTHALDGHGQQRGGNLLPRGEEHIHLPLGGLFVDFGGLGDEVVGGIALGGDHHHHIVALLIGGGDNVRHIVDALGVLDGAAAELLYNQCHYTFFPSSRPGRGRVISLKNTPTQGCPQLLYAAKPPGATHSMTIWAPWGAAERISTRQPVMPLSSRWVTQLRPKASAFSESIMAMMVGPAPLT